MINKQFSSFGNKPLVCYFSDTRNELVFELSVMPWIKSNKTVDIKGFYKALLDCDDFENLESFLTWFNLDYIPFLNSTKYFLPEKLPSSHYRIFYNENRVNIHVEPDGNIYFCHADVVRACRLPKTNYKSKEKCLRIKEGSVTGKLQEYFSIPFYIDIMTSIKSSTSYVLLRNFINGFVFDNAFVITTDSIELFIMIFEQRLVNKEDIFESWWKLAITKNPILI